MAQFSPLFAGMTERMRRRRSDVALPQTIGVPANAALAHELRTPVSCMIGFAELLLATPLSQSQREHARLIAQSGRQLLSLIEREMSDAPDESVASCKPKEVLEGCLNLLTPQAIAKGLHVATWCEEDMPSLVALDPCRLRQVLLNLIGNAIKFTQVGGIDIELRMSGGMLQISVIDSGIGIARERTEDIFRAYDRGPPDLSARTSGNGLGLAISQQLAASMGGTISVHSEPGAGSNFTLRLPLAVAARSAPVRARIPSVSQLAPRDQPVASTLAGERVLVAEDDHISRRLLVSLADKLGLDVSLAASGEEVIAAVNAAKLSGEPFSAVLMDLDMPLLDGIETTRRLRAEGYGAQELPIIALTAACSGPYIALCLEAGMQAHLAKPATALSLARELARFLPEERGDAEASDQLFPFPNSEPLQERYIARKQQLLANLRRALDGAAGGIDWLGIASELHKIAGVAGHFGEDYLGETSRRLEMRIRIASGPDESQRELRRAWPFLMQVA